MFIVLTVVLATICSPLVETVFEVQWQENYSIIVILGYNKQHFFPSNVGGMTPFPRPRLVVAAPRLRPLVVVAVAKVNVLIKWDVTFDEYLRLPPVYLDRAGRNPVALLLVGRPHICQSDTTKWRRVRYYSRS